MLDGMWRRPVSPLEVQLWKLPPMCPLGWQEQWMLLGTAVFFQSADTAFQGRGTGLIVPVWIVTNGSICMCMVSGVPKFAAVVLHWSDLMLKLGSQGLVLYICQLQFLPRCSWRYHLCSDFVPSCTIHGEPKLISYLIDLAEGWLWETGPPTFLSLTMGVSVYSPGD